MRRSSAAALIAALALAAACDDGRDTKTTPAPASSAAGSEPELAFVGSAACAECHADAAAAWRGSQHAHAIAPAEPNDLRGDCTQAEFRTREGGYFVHAPGPDGKPADFPVKYAFGLEPLQQVLVELPGGRLQAYTRAWDVQR